MKKIVLSILVCLSMMVMISCYSPYNVSADAGNQNAKVENNNANDSVKSIKIDAVKLAKDFYTEYLDESDYDKLINIKEKYMTKTLIDELEIRSMQMESDSVTGVQDSTGMKKIMEVNKGSGDNTATITFNFKNDEGTTTQLIESSVHFKNENGKALMDTLDMIIIDYDENNNDNMRQYQTKYANKDELTEEDKKEMQDIKKHYEDLYSQGYIN